jgi:hypothetical protein
VHVFAGHVAHGGRTNVHVNIVDIQQVSLGLQPAVKKARQQRQATLFQRRKNPAIKLRDLHMAETFKQ